MPKVDGGVGGHGRCIDALSPVALLLLASYLMNSWWMFSATLAFGVLHVCALSLTSQGAILGLMRLNLLSVLTIPPALLLRADEVIG